MALGELWQRVRVQHAPCVVTALSFTVFAWMMLRTGTAKSITFDCAEKWSLEASEKFGTFNLRAVALHEIGYAVTTQSSFHLVLAARNHVFTFQPVIPGMCSDLRTPTTPPMSWVRTNCMFINRAIVFSQLLS